MLTSREARSLRPTLRSGGAGRRRLAEALLVSVLLTTARHGIARADDPGVAEQLFRDGKRLMSEGKLAEACRAFEGSFRKEAAVSTLLNLADCLEKNHRYASAWTAFIEAQRMLRNDASKAALAAVASSRTAQLEARLSYLQIDVERPDIDGLEIYRNDVLLDRAEWGLRIAVDGGEYTVVARAPERQPLETTVRVGEERDWRTVKVTELISVAPPGTEMMPPPRATAPRRSRSAVSTWLVVGGGGLIVGSLVTGYFAKTKLDDAKGLCGADLRCPSESERATAQGLVDSARGRGNLATALAGTGVAAMSVGVAVWLFSRPQGARPTAEVDALHVEPVIGPSTVGVAVGGTL